MEQYGQESDGLGAMGTGECDVKVIWTGELGVAGKAKKIAIATGWEN